MSEDTLVLGNSLLEDGILGKGLKSPLVKSETTGDFETVSGDANVKQCINDLLELEFNERVMNEDMGVGLRSLLFEDTLAVIDLAPRRIVEAIGRYEPRVRNVRATGRQTGIRSAEIDVSWTLRSTGSRDSLVYPFYTEPPAGGVSSG